MDGHGDRGPSQDVSPGEAGCETDSSNGSCYACLPATTPEFLNACTNSSCVPFDDSRVTGLLPDGGLPPVPPIDAGLDVTPDAAADGAETQDGPDAAIDGGSE
jgi:hypothetical protein